MCNPCFGSHTPPALRVLHRRVPLNEEATSRIAHVTAAPFNIGPIEPPMKWRACVRSLQAIDVMETEPAVPPSPFRLTMNPSDLHTAFVDERQSLESGSTPSPGVKSVCATIAPQTPGTSPKTATATLSVASQMVEPSSPSAGPTAIRE
jgi:hypothetical protein